MITMYDTITLGTVPADPQAVAGYVGGRWPTYAPLVKAYPKAFHLSIAVNSSEDADCLDVESGDATNADIGPWIQRQLARGVKLPVIYTSLSNARDALASLPSGVQRSDIRLWTAHYTGRAHICTPACGFQMPTTADGTQYDDHALGRNLDASLLQDSFFIPPVPVDPYHYDWFDVGPFGSPWGQLNEREIVLHYDGARKHSLRYRGYLKLLQAQLQYLANRVYTVAHEQPLPDGHPSWSLWNRGWRYQQLIHRAEGKQLVF